MSYFTPSFSRNLQNYKFSDNLWCKFIVILTICVSSLLPASTKTAEAQTRLSYRASWVFTLTTNEQTINASAIFSVWDQSLVDPDRGYPDPATITRLTLPVPCHKQGNITVYEGIIHFDGGYLICDFPSFKDAVEKMMNHRMSLPDEVSVTAPWIAGAIEQTNPSQKAQPLIYISDQLHVSIDSQTLQWGNGQLRSHLHSTGITEPFFSGYGAYHAANTGFSQHLPSFPPTFSSFAADQGQNNSSYIYWDPNNDEIISERFHAEMSTHAMKIYVGYNPTTQEVFEGTTEFIGSDPHGPGVSS